MVSSVVKSRLALFTPCSGPFGGSRASFVCNHLQTFLRAAAPQPCLTRCFSFISAHFCTSAKNAHFPPFVFFHLPTPLTTVLRHLFAFLSLPHTWRKTGGYPRLPISVSCFIRLESCAVHFFFSVPVLLRSFFRGVPFTLHEVHG